MFFAAGVMMAKLFLLQTGKVLRVAIPNFSK
jgi:hypothetical protein